MSSEMSLLSDPEFCASLDALLDTHMPGTFPALSICAMQRGATVLEMARGWIDPDTRQMPVTAASLFDLASLTKLIVETSFLVQVDAGKIKLESRLVDVIPEFGRLNPREIGSGQDPHTREILPIETGYAGLTVDVAEVTFEHLLTHRSGLPPWRAVYLLAAEKPPAAPAAGDAYEADRWRRALAEIARFPFAGPVGEKVRYTDIGIMLLGEAVARLHGKRLDHALRDLVLEPLGLRAFTYSPLRNGIARDRIVPTEFDRSWRNRRAWGEVHDENACGVGGIAGHAGLFATVADVAQFGLAWLTGDPRLGIGPELRRVATSQRAQGQHRMGLGWMLKANHGASAGEQIHGDSFGHTGYTGTSLWIDPTRQLVCAVFTNRVYNGREEEGIYAFRRAIHDLIVEAVSK